ncbi:MAG TPA: bifunctional oligoribonuclease/PAP phosphatase NrnA [Longimicrobiales bacterium]|nr:bifunctional oligoribonuclease/PAP phosphatase NrnA [Longimicrobiales bacterium]
MTSTFDSHVPEHRVEGLERILALLAAARHVVLTTHVNADGDGAGSEVALALWLAARGKDVRIANPTAFPELYAYLLPDRALLAEGAAARRAVEKADLVVVLDTGEPKRIGRIHPLIEARPVALLDHHPEAEQGIAAAAAVRDTTACATGELIFDLLLLADGDLPWPAGVAEALYAAIVTDTGSFRFSNTTPRAHAIAAELLRRGVDPEAAYRRIYGTVPLRRVRLLRAALDRLEVDERLPISWITVPRKMLEEVGATGEDLEGLVEHARSIEGTEVALLFRETTEGGTKVSLRSNGGVDVNAIARQFGGGGHVKASGILMGASLDNATAQVLEATRLAVASLEAPPPTG